MRRIRGHKLPKEAYELEGEELKTYRTGFNDGNESNYFPACGGRLEAIYDWGYRDGKKYGDRKGKPWTLSELQKLAKAQRS
jgi:hypothetical protein